MRLEQTPDPSMEILVDSVREGSMDPWDLDIIELTDRYLAKIDVLEHRNLSISGRLFFFASVLLRLKAEYTAKGFLSLCKGEDNDIETSELEAFELDVDPLNEGYDTEEEDEQLRLPGMVVYPRTAGPRNRGLTLGDLIHALHRCEELDQRRKRSRGRDYASDAAQEEIIDIAHSDDLGGDISRMRSKMGLQPEEQEQHVPFETLLCENLSPTTAYMALLFLASNSEVKLHQRHFYNDLRISRTSEFQHELVTNAN